MPKRMAQSSCNGNVARCICCKVLCSADNTLLSREVAYLPEPERWASIDFWLLEGYIRDYFASEKLQLDGHGYVGGRVHNGSDYESRN